MPTRAALEQEAGEPISDEQLKEIKSQVVALGAAEGVKGPGGGLKAPGVDPPPRTSAPAAGARTRRSGVFRPYAGVSTAILFFTKTGRGGTDLVWFYDMTADGWSLDDKRNPLLPLGKLGPTPKEPLAEGEHDKNNLPDCLARWRQHKESERELERTAQSFCVPKAEIAEQSYDLSLNRYKELIHEAVEHRPPLEILAELRAIEQEILQGIEELEGMLR